jgi:hypothetical protein
MLRHGNEFLGEPNICEFLNFPFPPKLLALLLGRATPMFDAGTTALLRTVLSEICENLSRYENGVRAHVASKILEAAAHGQLSVEELKRVGRTALDTAPTMWR